jgi:hypothetical protein
LPATAARSSAKPDNRKIRMASPADLAALAIDPVFATLGVAATYTPPGGGAPIACTVIRRSPDLDVGLQRAVIRGDLIEVRRAEVPAPQKGGTFALGAETLTVREDPRHAPEDVLRLVHIMTVQ